MNSPNQTNKNKHTIMTLNRGEKENGESMEEGTTDIPVHIAIENEIMESQFQKRSNKTARSPPPNVSAKEATSTIITETLTTPTAKVLTDTLINTTPLIPAVTQDGISESRREEEGLNELDTLLVRLGSRIEDLSDFIKGRMNVHHEIRRLTSSIRHLYNSAMDKRDATVRPKISCVARESQTSPLQVAQTVEKLHQERDTGTPKRKRSTPHKAGEMETTTIKKVKATRVPLPSGTDTPKAMDKTPGTSEPKNQGEWKKVKNKKPRTTGEKSQKDRKLEKEVHSKRRSTLPDALLIKKGAQTFADILKKVKADSSLQELGENVVHIRRTLGGHLLIELNEKGDQTRTSSLREKLEAAVGQGNVVRTLSQEATVTIRDLDEITSDIEVLEALEKSCEKLKGSCRVRSIRPGYPGTQTAIISLPKKLLPEILKIGRIKIGWVSCRIRERNEPLSCFKCFEYGHRAAECKNNIVRENLCKNCGGEGHIAKNCRNKAKCAICTEKNLRSDHGIGSFSCPAYQEAKKRCQ